jgi:hypothetical protein
MKNFLGTLVVIGIGVLVWSEYKKVNKKQKKVQIKDNK